MFKLLLLVAVAAGTGLCGADLSGRWDGVEAPSDAAIFLNLNQLGQTISGALSTSDSPREVPIRLGELVGSELSFEVHDNATNRTVKFHLRLQDGRLSGQRTIGDEISRVTFWPAPNSTAYPVNPGVASTPAPTHTVEPEYTEKARASRVQGEVVLKLVIGSDGIVVRDPITIVRSLGMGLDEKAVDCVKQWRFIPSYRDGKPVAAPATIIVNFRLR